MSDPSEPSSARPGSRMMRGLGSIVLGGLRDAITRASEELAKSSAPLASTEPEPPVIAQLMIEIRSDGSRTVARGALHDLRTQESAQVHAEGRTPSDLALSLLGSLISLPGSPLQMLRPKTSSAAEEPKPEEPSDPKKPPEPDPSIDIR